MSNVETPYVLMFSKGFEGQLKKLFKLKSEGLKRKLINRCPYYLYGG